MTTEKKDQIVKKEALPSERFTNMVVNEFTSTIGEGGAKGLTRFHKRLCQNYFINVDMALKKAEVNRMKKKEQYRDKLEITWSNVNMNQLALDVVACARVGLDPSLSNQVHVIPYKNNTTNKYDVNLMPGYRGKELIAKKYGLEIPDDVIVELVYDKDHFKPIKKDINNKTEAYEFQINDPNDRGEIIGGFYYHVFDDNPRKNILRYFTRHDLEKRKPSYASAEFWGGEKDKYVNGQKKGKEKVEGWFEEMMWKTLYRAAYNSITIDSQKIDDDFVRISENENKAKPGEVPIEQLANKELVSFDEVEIIDDKPKETSDSETPEKPPASETKDPEPKKTPTEETKTPPKGEDQSLFEEKQSKPDF
jgi:recombination protein RecT